ncbi:sensor histidine kinase [Pseudonocardia sp. ICBG1293]|uniref:sensor histidine kinase n=1 Tax=Pseudonocardia sp. ICBG1293 TaxID=2844382 RepID=UPI001CCFE610|nr:histidine kinase [Pseudonocardia sp. ICBG1293]
MHPHPEPPPRTAVERFDDRLTALGLAGPRRRDAALAVLVAAGTLAVLAPVVTAPGPAAQLGLEPGPTAWALGLVTVQNLLLALRRTAPGVCLGLTVALQLAIAVVLPVGAAVRGPATAIAAGTCGSRLPARRAGVLVGVAAVVDTAVVLTGTAVRPSGSGDVPLGGVGEVVVQVLSAVLVYGGPLLLGVYLRTRRRYAELDRLHTAGVVAAHRERADAAVARERARMARELHDVAAHHLSAMVVQAAVVERLVERDPAEARRTASRLREQGRRTLHDLRLVVGALREPGAGGAEGESPVPGLAELDALVEQARELGGPVELTRRGDPGEASPVADVTCHRVVQEALANAREHAPGAPVRVTVTHGEGRVAVEVVNGPARGTPPVPGGVPGTRGFGLAGMRERAQLVGGTFEAGRTGDDGWRVRLVVPHDPGPETGGGRA